jgi:hypothetical protein
MGRHFPHRRRDWLNRSKAFFGSNAPRWRQSAGCTDLSSLSLSLVRKGRASMFDEMAQLQDNTALLLLLEHYADAGGNDCEAWQDRLMQLAGVDSRQLVKLHGELLAQSWVEQNTGITPVLKGGVAAACYRITGAGLRAVRWARKALVAGEKTARGAA